MTIDDVDELLRRKLGVDGYECLQAAIADGVASLINGTISAQFDALAEALEKLKSNLDAINGPGLEKAMELIQIRSIALQALTQPQGDC